VISGYLITHNIIADAQSGKFSFATFYIRRARRILPALLFTIAIVFIAGALLLAPETLRELSKESTHAMLSISNIQYWRELSSYFAQASDQLPLQNPEAMFFLMPFRIFEFAIGGFVVFTESARKASAISEIFSCLGLLTVATSMMVLSAASPFWVATLFPCLGTAAVIHCGQQTLAARLIATRPALAIGRASYSLYLCHRPIVFLRE
jgi:peptidoglycan/LPS O-acetylase OafA/YrhL